MPQIGSVRDFRVAQENHLLQPHVAGAERLPADTERVLVETELHRVCRLRIYDGLKREAWLLGRVGVAARVVGIARPVGLLPVDQRLEAGSQLVQPFGWNDVFRITKPSSRSCSGSIWMGWAPAAGWGQSKPDMRPEIAS